MRLVIPSLVLEILLYWRGKMKYSTRKWIGLAFSTTSLVLMVVGSGRPAERDWLFAAWITMYAAWAIIDDKRLWDLDKKSGSTEKNQSTDL